MGPLTWEDVTVRERPLSYLLKEPLFLLSIFERLMVIRWSIAAKAPHPRLPGPLDADPGTGWRSSSQRSRIFGDPVSFRGI
jgi:hypothetical protein